jgi:hypothetical protein
MSAIAADSSDSASPIAPCRALSFPGRSATVLGHAATQRLADRIADTRLAGQ